jgi:hypothetical protein
MEALAQQIIAEYYGNPVNPAFVAIEIGALVLGHGVGTLDVAHERLYAALVSAGQIPDHAAADRANLSEFSKRISAAQAKSAAAEAAYERELADAPPSVESN